MARDPRIEKARILWEESEGTITNKEIAARLGIKNERMVGAWKSRYGWDRRVISQGRKRIEEKPKNVAQRRRESSHALDKAIAGSLAENEELTEKERIFCAHYIKTFNRKTSVIRAGYANTWPSQRAEALLRKPAIKAELAKLRAIRLEVQELATVTDIVELHMRIAFADITDVVKFGQKEMPLFSMGGVLKDEDGNMVMKTVNDVSFRDDADIDGQLVTEIKQGRDGVIVKMADKQKSLAFLERYFMINPMDQHQIDYENAKMELEQKKAGADNSQVENIEIEVEYATDKGVSESVF